MSKILELAQEIDTELTSLKYRADYLENELYKEKQKNKQLLLALNNFVKELEERCSYE